MFGYVVALPLIYIFIYGPLTNLLDGTVRPSFHHEVAFNNTLFASDEPCSCPPKPYTTYILTTDPLIIYIEGFLSHEESTHLLEISQGKFAPAAVTTAGEISVQQHIRLSEIAVLDRSDIVRCIEHRARSFQGWRPEIKIERLTTQRYGIGGHYVHHYDWSGARRGLDRVSSMMVYVDVPEEGGGTEFPRIRMPDEKGPWCKFLECRGEPMGVTFKPIRGNAIFWVNLTPDGRGYEETWHAGLPVISGVKVGLNIWSWS